MRTDRWALPIDDLLRELDTGRAGLSSAEAAARLPKHDPTRRISAPDWWPMLLRQFRSPMVLILAVATVISMLLGNVVEGLLIVAMIVISGLLGFVQERRAHGVMNALLAKVRTHTDVLRDGREVELLPEQVVPGDIVVLRAGDLVPADLRIVESTNMLVDESTLTGEPVPVEKSAFTEESATGLSNTALYQGSHVVSGRGTAVVVTTDTRFGSLLEQLQARDVETKFEQQLTGFGMMLTRIVMALVVVVLVINVILDRPLVESMLFALAIGVGITPEMLPAIVMVSLSIGARQMAGKNLLVKRLDAIEDIGAMTLLCCDKTGTLTRGVVEVDRAMDPSGIESATVLRLAALNAALQRDYPNPMDRVIAAHTVPDVAMLAELPYDFQRRRLSVLTTDAELICKGAFESVLQVCTQVRDGSGTAALAAQATRLRDRYEELSANGYRVLGVATKSMPNRDRLVLDDECELVFEGFLALLDPVTETAASAIAEFRSIGVELALITGDNPAIAAAIARSAGMPTHALLTGDEIGRLTDAQLVEASRDVRVFAAVDPLQKERIVVALKRGGQAVGFLGDGINDTAALHVADVGIAVDSGADAAKQAAAMVVLDKNLLVIAEGIRLGRRTFANTLKYVRITMSANFGNMVSLVIASAVLPFIPLLPAQVLLLNLLSDGPALAVATDRVDADQERTPRTWDLHDVRRFMIRFGLVSTFFDVAAFILLHWYLRVSTQEFRSSWFVLSLLTELIALLVLRTALPSFRSRPGALLLGISLLMVIAGLVCVMTAVGTPLGLQPLTMASATLILGMAAGYAVINELLKLRQ